MFLTNKYTRWYINIINRAQTRTIDGTFERHHILPKSLGGGNSHNNLVKLTPREHFVCHKLLVRMTTGEHKRKMSFALLMFTRNNPYQRRILTARDYDEIRRRVSQAAREQNIGKVISSETRAKMSATKKITHNTPEVRAKISAYNSNRTPEHRSRLGAAHRGKVVPTSVREQMSVRNTGSGNPHAQSWMVEFEDGRPVECVVALRDWCRVNNLTFPGVYRTLLSKRFSQGVRVTRV